MVPCGYVSAGERSPPQVNLLSEQPDCKNERTGPQHLVESRGLILLLSPKYHREVTGAGTK